MEPKNLIALLILLTFSALAMATERPRYTWTDDKNRTHQFYQDCCLVAVVEEENSSEMKDLKDLTKVGHGKKIALYQSKTPLFNEQGQALKTLPNNHSPVFAETRRGQAIFVAMGGIIVYFDKKISDEKVKAFFVSKNLTVVRKMPYSRKNAWLIESESGLHALRLASILKEENASAGIIAAYPDWGRQWSIKNLK